MSDSTSQYDDKPGVRTKFITARTLICRDIQILQLHTGVKNIYADASNIKFDYVKQLRCFFNFFT